MTVAPLWLSGAYKTGNNWISILLETHLLYNCKSCGFGGVCYISSFQITSAVLCVLLADLGAQTHVKHQKQKSVCVCVFYHCDHVTCQIVLFLVTLAVTRACLSVSYRVLCSDLQKSLTMITRLSTLCSNSYQSGTRICTSPKAPFQKLCCDKHKLLSAT